MGETEREVNFSQNFFFLLKMKSMLASDKDSEFLAYIVEFGLGCIVSMLCMYVNL